MFGAPFGTVVLLQIAQKSIVPQKLKKFVYYNEELVHKFQTQLSRKLQRFRTWRKNKKCSICHDLSEYIIFSYDCNLLGWSFKKIQFFGNSILLFFYIFLFDYIFFTIKLFSFCIDMLTVEKLWNWFSRSKYLKDQSSNLQPYEKMIYSERSWKMEHFLFLRHVLSRCSFRDNWVWNLCTSSSL